MITKAEIQSIDLDMTSCMVRMPYFESAGMDYKATVKAYFINQPGCYNSYKVGDIVEVAFEDGQPQLPIVIGKFYTGTGPEQARGAISCNTLFAQNATIPINTYLSYDIDGIVVADGVTKYTSILDILNKLQSTDTKNEQNYIDARKAIGNFFGKTLYRMSFKKQITKAETTTTAIDITNLDLDLIFIDQAHTIFKTDISCTPLAITTTQKQIQFTTEDEGMAYITIEFTVKGESNE